VADLVNRTGLRAFADAHMARIALEAGAVAVGARLGAAVTREVFAHQLRIGFAVAPRHVGDDPFERVLLADLFALRGPRLHDVAELDLLFARAVQDDLLHLGREVFERCLHIELVVLRQAFQHAEVKAVAPVPALDGAAGQAQAWKSDHPLGVEEFHRADAVAAGAGALRRVEGEHARLQLGDRVVAHRAGKAGVEQVLLAAVHLHGQGALLGQIQCGLEALGQSLAQGVTGLGVALGPDLETVDHHVDVVLLVLLQLGQVFGLIHLAAHAKAHIAQRLHLLEHLFELAFFLAGNRRQHHQFGVFGQGHHRVHHLGHGLGLQRQVVVGAMRRAGTREQQAQVVVDLGHRAYRGAWVVAGRLLLNADRRRQAFDQVHIGLVHQLQKLPRIGRQAFHIAALAFGVQRVKR